ncbi:MAG: sigma-70 family RNA polymerase sigma factor [Acidobacteria bacterium]|nr:sigma-70 family RNA polymerase sigma factor [Acidobacteriota bacterium]
MQQLALNASLASVTAAEQPVTELDDIEALVRNYRPRLLRFVAFSIGDADLAESITQDCLLKAYNGRAHFRGDCSINTWLTSIAVNLVRDQQRLQKFRFWRQAHATAIDVADAANFLPSSARSPESHILVREKATQVMAALQTLSANQRSVFLMRFSEEMDLSEIAAITKMPLNTVKTHLHRALKSIRAQVSVAQANLHEALPPPPGKSLHRSADASLSTSSRKTRASEAKSGTSRNKRRTSRNTLTAGDR